ncbi:RNA-directed DNA polymerase, eukaryota, reverse transcriptase zinc-binding domain protein [Tanacetum coccineum]
MRSSIPFLFILAMEGLHAFTRKAEDLGLFKGAFIGQDNMYILNLMYADDVIFFSDWSRINAHNLICMLRCFFLVSGLKINVYKSKVIGIGVSDEEFSCMANVIGCGVAKLPLKYLGVLIGYNMSRYDPGKVEKMFSKQESRQPRLVLFIIFMGFVEASTTFLLVDPVLAHGKLYCLRFQNLSIKVWIFFLYAPGRLWSSKALLRGGAKKTQFDALLYAIGDVSILDQGDSWQWSLNRGNGFSMASARNLVDASILDVDIVATC